MNSVLVVDDEPKILDIVRSYLEKNGYRALTARNGREALAALRSNTVSLMLLDLMLPDLSGEELCRRVRSESDMPIIMMTAKVDEESIIHGLRIGADDYVTKPFSPRQLMARVAAALRRSRGGPLEGRVFSAGVLTVDTGNRRASKNGAPLNLTPNEYRILALLMSRPHKIFTRDEIIAGVKTDTYDGFDRAIDSHIKNLRQKIEDDTRNPRYILTIYGVGYRFGEGPQDDKP
ncbi:MAG: response regulator transcription factor [Treponema sp.]|nr:response regulator transcription factor [Treponema sp.]